MEEKVRRFESNIELQLKTGLLYVEHCIKIWVVMASNNDKNEATMKKPRSFSLMNLFMLVKLAHLSCLVEMMCKSHFLSNNNQSCL